MALIHENPIQVDPGCLTVRIKQQFSPKLPFEINQSVATYDQGDYGPHKDVTSV